MKSAKSGENIWRAEVAKVSEKGLYLQLDGEELFLPFSEFPWFRRAAFDHVLQVERLSMDHLHWPALDIDLSVESIRHPERFPLFWRPSSS
jgi:hypothetical protein